MKNDGKKKPGRAPREYEIRIVNRVRLTEAHSPISKEAYRAILDLLVPLAIKDMQEEDRRLAAEAEAKKQQERENPPQTNTDENKS